MKDDMKIALRIDRPDFKGEFIIAYFFHCSRLSEKIENLCKQKKLKKKDDYYTFVDRTFLAELIHQIVKDRQLDPIGEDSITWNSNSYFRMLSRNVRNLALILDWVDHKIDFNTLVKRLVGLTEKDMFVVNLITSQFSEFDWSAGTMKIAISSIED